MTQERFEQKFNELDLNDKLAIYNDYAINVGYETINHFDEDFLDMAFTDKVELARAVYFGEIKSWEDPYITFNGYGNLKSMTEGEVEEWISDSISGIYDHEDAWDYYIDEDDEE